MIHRQLEEGCSEHVHLWLTSRKRRLIPLNEWKSCGYQLLCSRHFSNCLDKRNKHALYATVPLFFPLRWQLAVRVLALTDYDYSDSVRKLHVSLFSWREQEVTSRTHYNHMVRLSGGGAAAQAPRADVWTRRRNFLTCVKSHYFYWTLETSRVMKPIKRLSPVRHLHVKLDFVHLLMYVTRTHTQGFTQNSQLCPNKAYVNVEL